MGKKELEEIISNLTRWSALYYAGTPEVSDEVYDAQRDYLESQDPENPFLAVVGAPPEENATRHKIPMFSLDKCSGPEEFKKWFANLPKGVELVAQLKLDGCSISLEYDDGKLVKGLTRGDGLTGEDYTQNLSRCHTKEILKVKKKFSGSVRGEAVIHKDDFTPANFPNDEDPTQTESNRRNSASGAIKKSGSKRVKWVRMVFYDIAPDDFATESDKIQALKDLGLPVAETFKIRTLEEALALYDQILSQRSDLPFSIDGLVFKINDLSLQKEMGYRDNRPKGQRALKFPTMSGVSVLRFVEENVGHSGAVTPRAHYDPILIDGRTFSHANLNNYDIIESLNLAIGDSILVEIGGDIIPKISGKVANGDKRKVIKPPLVCPSCKGPLTKEGKRHKCLNVDCSGQAIRKVRNWVTKVGIKFYGPESQELCFDKGLIQTPVDLYTVDPKKLGALIGPGNAQNVLAEVEAHKELPLNIFMGSLGIPFLGRRNASHLIEQGVDTLEKFRSLSPDRSFEGFKKSLGTIIQSIQDLAPIIDGLLEAGVMIKQKQKKQSSEGGSLTGKKFVITGTLSQTREVFKEMIEKAGGECQSSVSTKTDYLLVGEKAGSKLAKAQSLGVRILREEDFLELLGKKA